MGGFGIHLDRPNLSHTHVHSSDPVNTFPEEVNDIKILLW